MGGSTNEWDGLYDRADTVRRTIARDVGFDPAAPDSAALADFMETYLAYIEAMHRLGPEGLELLSRPVPDADRKLAAMREHLRAGRSWPSVERKLAIPWHEQVRMITHGHESRLWMWGLEERIDFEEMARAGASVNSLAQMFRLPYHQTRKLAQLFR